MVNSFFTEDGKEIEEHKNLINIDFQNRIKKLKNDIFKVQLEIKNINPRDKKITKKRLYLKELQKEWFLKDQFNQEFKQAYIMDVHQEPKYKELYILKKELSAEQSILIEEKQVSNKIRLKEINEELTELKKKMEKITKTNSLIRLEYKMRIAFGFLKSRCGLDIRNKNFDVELENKEKYTGKFESYLNTEIDDDLNKTFIENLEDNLSMEKQKENILSSDVSNNYTKLNVLIYLLLPKEIKGDFLGFIKHNYYGLKNIEFIELEEEKTQKFFHNLRLFEKGVKNFDIFSYEVSDLCLEDKEDSFNKFCKDILNIKKTNINNNQQNHNIFNKNIILTLMKYYEHVFKLCNDVEVVGLLHFMAQNNEYKTVKETIESKKFKVGKYFRYSKFLEELTIKEIKNEVLTSKKSKNKVECQIRNNIAHVNYNDLFLKPLARKVEIKKLEQGFIETIGKLDIDFNILGYNFLNDFQMKKKSMIFNMNKYIKEEGKKEKTAREFIEKRNKEQGAKSKYKLKNINEIVNFLNMIELYKDNELKGIELEKFSELVGEIKVGKKKYNIKKVNSEEKKDVIIELSNDYGVLLGNYKRVSIMKIKEKLIELIDPQKGKEYSLTFKIYNKNKNRSKKLVFKILGEKIKVYLDGKSQEKDKLSIFEAGEKISIKYKFENQIFEIQSFIGNDDEVIHHHGVDFDKNEITTYKSVTFLKEMKKVLWPKDKLSKRWDYKHWIPCRPPVR